jgi:hypothetical protein
MLRSVFKKYEQAFIVVGCAATSIATLGWMVNDIHLREKNQLKIDYENKINKLKQEIASLKVNLK